MEPKGIHLTRRNFIIVGDSAVVKTKLPGMLLIYADWCGHCTRFKPVFNKVCSRAGNDFVCASIESEELTNAPALSKALKFSGFPTIKFFDSQGNLIGDYPDTLQRDVESLLNYIEKVKYHSQYH